MGFCSARRTAARPTRNDIVAATYAHASSRLGLAEARATFNHNDRSHPGPDLLKVFADGRKSFLATAEGKRRIACGHTQRVYVS